MVDPVLWNGLPSHSRQSKTVSAFNMALKTPFSDFPSNSTQCVREMGLKLVVCNVGHIVVCLSFSLPAAAAFGSAERQECPS